MSEVKASIIIPTRHRSELLEERLKTIRAHTPELSKGLIVGEAELLLVVDNDDNKTINTFIHDQLLTLIFSYPLETPMNKWNLATKFSKGEWLVLLSDDCIPEPNWLTHALNMTTYGFIGLPDGVTGNRNNYFTPLYMATRTWLKEFNGGVLVIPVYKTWYADIETCFRAKRAGHYMIGPNSIVQQLHADYGTAEDDEIYNIGKQRRNEDLFLFNERARKGFPNDFEAIL